LTPDPDCEDDPDPDPDPDAEEVDATEGAGGGDALLALLTALMAAWTVAGVWVALDVVVDDDDGGGGGGGGGITEDDVVEVLVTFDLLEVTDMVEILGLATFCAGAPSTQIKVPLAIPRSTSDFDICTPFKTYVITTGPATVTISTSLACKLACL